MLEQIVQLTPFLISIIGGGAYRFFLIQAVSASLVTNGRIG
jgi:hypothetical protein